MDNRIIERAAKALHSHGADNLCSDVLWDDLHQSEADQFRSWARAALEAAALTPPEGYVLVPVKLPEKMLDALYCAEGDMSDDDMQDLWKQVIAARPEVP